MALAKLYLELEEIKDLEHAVDVTLYSVEQNLQVAKSVEVTTALAGQRARLNSVRTALAEARYGLERERPAVELDEELRQTPLLGFRIEEIHAFVAVGDDDEEGIPAAQMGNVVMPLVAADATRLRNLRPYAEHAAQATGRPVRLLRFSDRTVIETIEP